MNDEYAKRARQVFMELSTLDASAVQGELDRLVGSDRKLREAVISLLDARADADDAGLMTAPTAALPGGMITETVGSVIGPYKVLQTIGEGGFGSVFLAEQSRPVRRRVALKIIKLGMDTKQVIARFEAERQALALMDHPHIARVFDAGSTESGRPYFVMEYVVGDAITTFADAYKLGIRARLALFEQVCSAVQHAHTKGIIHRDLKPANVLVSMVDGKPFAKVIDFGIAKATVAPLTDRTLFTEHRQLIGTPEYMSPEQAEGSPDIDTRTDVYALGVLLYELLTGQTPFEGARLRSAAWAEMQRIIREEEPPAPSLRLSRGIGTLAQTASARGTDPVRLSAAVRGELDWVVMKALDKDRARRYETSAQLAQDIGRHLSGEPVMAAPPSRLYKAKKFVRRNKGAVIAGTAVAAALLIGLIGTAWSLTIAKQAEAEAEHQALVAGRNAEAAELARIKAEAQRDFAARSGRALLALLNGDEDNADLSYVRSVNASLDQSSEPFDSELIKSDVGVDLKALSAISLDTALKVIEANATLREQADRAREGVGAMLGILVFGEPGGPVDSHNPETGISEFETDPLGVAIAFGTELAESLKEERDRLHRQNSLASAAIKDAVIRIMESDLAVDASPKLPTNPEYELQPTWSSREQGHAWDDDGFSIRKKHRDGTTSPLSNDEVLPAFTAYLAASLSYAIDANQGLRTQSQIAREAMDRISSVIGCEDCDEHDAHVIGDVFYMGWLMTDEAKPFLSAPEDELRLRALAAFGELQARLVWEEKSKAEWSAYTANLALAQNAMDAGDWPAARAILAECPDSKRGWEWDFMRGHAESVAHSYTGDASSLSPSGQIVFSSTGTWVRFYDAATNTMLSEYLFDSVEWILGAKFSADESTCVLFGENDWRRADVNTPTKVWMSVAVPVRAGGREPSVSVPGRVRAVSPDGSSFVVDNSEWVDGICGIYGRDGRKVSDIERPMHAADVVAYSPSGDYIAVVLRDKIRLYTPSGEIERDFAANTVNCFRIVISPDGRYIASSAQMGAHAGITVWNRNGDVVLTSANEERPHAHDRLWFTPDSNTIISSAFGYDTIAWHLDGTEKARFSAPYLGARRIDFGSDGSLFAASTLQGVWIVDTATGDTILVDLPSGPDGYALVTPDSRGLVHLDAGSLTEMDIEGRVLSSGSMNQALYLGLSGVTEDRVFLNDVNDFPRRDGLTCLNLPFRHTRQRVRWDAERCAVYAAAIVGANGAAETVREVRLPDGSRTIAADRRTLRFTDTTTGRIVLTLPVELEVASLALSPEADRLVVTFVDGTLEVLDTRPVEVQQAAIAAENDRRDRVRPLVRGLLESDAPTGELGSRLASHPELSPAERHSAYELLTPRLFDIEREARNALRELTKGAMSTEEGRAAVASAELPERVRARAIELAQAWEYTPRKPTIDQELSEETRRRRLAEATLALNEILSWDTPPRHMDEAPIVAALKTRAEILGKHDPLTAQARWLHGTLITFQGRAADGLNLCRQAADDMAADPEADPLLLSGVFYNLVQAELAHGTFEAAETRFRQLLVVLDGLLESDADDALAFRSAGPGEPFRLGYGYEQILRSPLTGNTRFGPDEQRARTRDWIGHARRVGLRGLLIGDSLGYLIIDVGAEEEPYAVVIPNHEARSLIRLFPNEVEVNFAHALSLVRSGDYREAFDMASTAQKEAARSGKRPHAIPVAVQALAAAHLGDEADARSFRDRLQTLKQQPEAERLDPGWSNASMRSMNSDRIIDILLREIDDTLAGRPPMIE